MTTTIDKWGCPLVTPFKEDYEPYMTDKQTNVTYICYTDAAKRIIRREKTEGTVTTVEFSYGTWADRATLTYAPINGSLDVEA